MNEGNVYIKLKNSMHIMHEYPTKPAMYILLSWVNDSFCIVFIAS